MTHIKLAVISFFLILFSSKSFSGVVDIAVDPGKRAAIGAVYNDGTSFLLVANERNGGVRVEIPDQDNVVRSIVVTQFDGRVFSFSLQLLGIGVGGLTSLEPFAVPGFASIDENLFVVAQFDIENFISSGANFSMDEVITVSDGSFANMLHIEFFDASALSFDPEIAANSLLDTSFISSLPQYTGDVEVVTVSRFSIPSPSTLLLIVGCMPLIIYKSRRKIGYV